MADRQGVDALAREIIAAAHERANEMVAAARARAADEVRRAQEEAAAARARVVGEARREAARERTRVEAAARLEARRHILAAREALIARVLDEARARLAGGLSAEERRVALEKAVFESAVALGGGHLAVRTNRQDAPFLSPELLQGLEARLAAQGIAAELEPGPTADILGGAIVAQDGGRVVIDRSFDARLEQQLAELRNQAWEVLRAAVPERVAL